MTKPIFFDTDCISAFLWVDEDSIVAKLYPKRIVIPKQVYNELSNPCISHLKQKIDLLVENKEVVIEEILIDTPEYYTYMKLTNKIINEKCIGNGEAAAIAMSKEQNGILASNNLQDVIKYVNEYNIKHITTGDIMQEALEKGLLTEEEGNLIWQKMIMKRRRLGSSTFSQYLKKINYSKNWRL